MGRRAQRSTKAEAGPPCGRRAKWAKALKLVLLNIGLMLILIYSVERILYATNPRRHLPFDGVDSEELYTWGYPVEVNRHGFREKEFVEPKPAGLRRIMVLGDSITWGVGIATEDRYTDILQRQLASEAIEVLNCGLPGGPTVYEREILKQFIDIVEPDRIVLGFCLNDPQPKEQTHSVERERFDERYGGVIGAVVGGLDKIALLQLSDRVEKAIYRSAELAGTIPPWTVALDRVYDPNSVEWRSFVGALRDIKRMSDERGLSPPIFAVLNQGVYTDRPTDYAHPDEMLKLYLKWYRRAEGAAAELGYVTVSFEDEIAAQLPNTVLAVNVLDVHPCKELHAIYAEKLLPLLRQWEE